MSRNDGLGLETAKGFDKFFIKGLFNVFSKIAFKKRSKKLQISKKFSRLINKPFK